jgi:hypothetical protein
MDISTYISLNQIFPLFLQYIYSPEPYNLNQMSHDSAMSIIQALLDADVKIACCYIDTVGIAEHYKRKLEREFPGLQFVVESKADAKYPCCSAGSVGKQKMHLSWLVNILVMICSVISSNKSFVWIMIHIPTFLTLLQLPRLFVTACSRIGNFPNRL